MMIQLRTVPLRSVRRLSFSSVNTEELQKFAKVGNDWWESSATSGTGPLHAMNPCRISFIRSRLAASLNTSHLFEREQLKGVKILDVGCGGGLLSESLARLGAEVTAIDPSPENIAVATAHAKQDPNTSKINFEANTIEKVVASGRKFDAVCSLEVIEHVDIPKTFLEACSLCLNPGGSLFVSTINRTRKSYAVAIVGAEYLLGILPRGTHDWNKFVKPEEVSKILQDKTINCEVKEITGMVISPNKKFLTDFNGISKWVLCAKDTDVNYILHAVKK